MKGTSSFSAASAAAIRWLRSASVGAARAASSAACAGALQTMHAFARYQRALS
jgi:hypothetical protein